MVQASCLLIIGQDAHPTGLERSPCICESRYDVSKSWTENYDYYSNS
ncbi:MAG: hypothetical protein WCP16_09275 [Pseudanabaena sp. ELA645]